MTAVTLERFCEFFKAVHGYAPYPWQERLAQRAVNGDWPGAIDLPTGSGKTACIDIAMFGQACHASLPVKDRTSPRRIFFCVNRRVIVDEAYQRARHIAETLWRAERDDDAASILRDIAAALRAVGGTNGSDNIPPLDVLELRGGIYRDNRWARSITQPTIVCTTLDQLGSRLLFRGYGVSSNAAPIQAALIAYDSLILLDEAHISRPFLQTLQSVRAYLDSGRSAEQDIGAKPVVVVPMTATPNDEMKNRGVIELAEDDRTVESLNDRLKASKPIKLQLVDDGTFVDTAVDEAITLAADKPMAVGIMVNRVATAKAVYDALQQARQAPDKEQENAGGKKKRKGKNKPTIDPKAVIELVIGSMRAIDRDMQAERLRPIVGSDRPKPNSTQTSFVVATQCLEVGADYDFDVLVTECASLDALRQRFGRLNRAGRPIETKGVILANKKEIKPDDKLDDSKPLDLIYGNALARTWNWLSERATDGSIDFGIDSFDAPLRQHCDGGRIPTDLLAPSAWLNAPVMLPTYLDFWCQTAPRPVPDPDASLFIHGERRGEPDVQVCWRADLVKNGYLTREVWCDVVALLPPTSAECMSVPIGRLRAWLKQANATEREKELKKRDDNDLYDTPSEDDERTDDFRVDGVVWRGIKESKRMSELTKQDDLRPGDTIALPTAAGGWDELGHVPALERVNTELEEQATDNDSALEGDPEAAKSNDLWIDVAEVAFRKARDRAALRLHQSLQDRFPKCHAFRNLFDRASDDENPPKNDEWVRLLKAAADTLGEAHPLADDVRNLVDAKYGLRADRYPDNRGFVLTTRNRIGASSDWHLPSLDEGEDELSRTQREQPVLLADHTNHVASKLSEAMAQLPLETLSGVFSTAVQLHDIGKAEDRFQAMLRRTNRTDAWLLVGAALLAKSDGLPMNRRDRDAARRRAALPAGFRHEMLSAQLAERSGQLPDDAAMRDLILHLIAAHHGYARPFAPVVKDEELPAVEVDGITLSHEERKRLIPPHRLNSGIAERFWLLTRRFGWWGLAYLETVLRLADQQASAAEDAGEYENAASIECAEVAS